eukprot:g3694.t1
MKVLSVLLAVMFAAPAAAQEESAEAITDKFGKVLTDSTQKITSMIGVNAQRRMKAKAEQPDECQAPTDGTNSNLGDTTCDAEVTQVGSAGFCCPGRLDMIEYANLLAGEYVPEVTDLQTFWKKSQ